MAQLRIPFNTNNQILLFMQQDKITRSELIALVNKENLNINMVDNILLYLKNIRGKFDDSTFIRAKAHYKKLTEESFTKYWEFLKALNYTI